MSRAFIKDRDDAPEEGLPDLPASDHPNYVTAAGLAELRERLASANAAGDTREARRLQKRLDAASVVDEAAVVPGEVALGSRVVIEVAGGAQQKFSIVGEDQADPVNGSVSWTSPLGEALLGKRAGDNATWRRPVGDVEVRIVEVAAG